MLLQPFALRRSGVSKYSAIPSLNQRGQSLSRVCSPQLKAIWCVASWTIVATVRAASGRAKIWLICCRRLRPPAAAPLRLDARQIVHRHAVAQQPEVADDRLARVAELRPGELQVRLPVGKDDGDQRELGRMKLETPVRPEIDERHVQPLEQRAAPLGVGRRRVVEDQVVRRRMHAESVRQLGQEPFGDFVAGERLEGPLVAGVLDLLVGRDCPKRPIPRQQQQPAVLGLRQDSPRHLDRLAVARSVT